MPFVSDIVGPQLPVQTSPPLATGALRRTSTIDTHPDGDGSSDVDLRASDVAGRGPDAVDTLGHLGLRAHLTGRVIDGIAAVPPDDRLSRLIGHRVGPGFRSAVAELLPGEVDRASLLHLLLDDWVGAALVSGYALQYRGIELGVEQKLPAGTADRMAGICAGFAPDASLVSYARRHDIVPTARGPLAPPIELAHAVEPLRPNGMRRYRRLDLCVADDRSADFDAHFRDSHMDSDGVETIVHEYTVTGSVDTSTRTITAVTADVRVLPWQECPGAIASAQRVQGFSLTELRGRIRGEFVGTSTCTHLNDTLRAIGDLDALFDLRSGLDDV
ncbi:DUF2889 domain-containing protein [Mycolicibacterium holsaticum]|uniref:DUF2889 domain-containing protein n=1 Tax=Mycolicibacterium holsaticum TaxID=152142 RepID=UPI001C7DB88E|nr:DUF2889 domain-containing protein [Mycolicibacterium holsaticum]MDA4110022.1 hypothetical protein [Mycolicibacterium holsaticum DSM 44478 = JCM 12374]QZA12061.1 DUF2889 domain-containing protein [Mycolicibacterium holsaticum DSM 44478 = JCM 12374]UNC10452.1 DUF2889 domain-containing protein [Mycolicibacterium holsaticum DSM 44478 = JCM 12374]